MYSDDIENFRRVEERAPRNPLLVEVHALGSISSRVPGLRKQAIRAVFLNYFYSQRME